MYADYPLNKLSLSSSYFPDKIAPNDDTWSVFYQYCSCIWLL